MNGRGSGPATWHGACRVPDQVATPDGPTPHTGDAAVPRETVITMKLKLTADQVKNAQWLQFTPKKTDQLTAFAVDPTSLERTGVLRFVNGAVVPEVAIPAQPTTPRDAFSVRLLELADAARVEREAAEAYRASKRKAPKDGVTIRGDVAEVWKDGAIIGSFPAARLEEIPALMTPVAEAPKGKRGGKKTAAA